MSILDCTGRRDPLAEHDNCVACGHQIDLHEYVFPTLTIDEREAWMEMLDDVLETGEQAPVVLICESLTGQRISVSPVIDDATDGVLR